ncbi:MAG TPA: methyltransferase type 11 [Lentisphaeria bacterium]|nr:MAG: hypothetical protein A2X47_08570 [Lentisphaerae bacterium GWF2_38_69]HBM15198.1 methyltransferase type 11 [Lentisphaeria bacterium]
MNNTSGEDYTKRLFINQNKWWKRLLCVQMPYALNLKRLKLGFFLDIGCGIGRNLINLNGNGIGIDHNKDSIEICRKHNLMAFTVNEFLSSEYAKKSIFDSILISHVLEHLTEDESLILLSDYLPCLKENGKVIIIVPQEAGFKSDPTHKTFIEKNGLLNITCKHNLKLLKTYSFPFPRFIGKIFKYNETYYILEKVNP